MSAEEVDCGGGAAAVRLPPGKAGRCAGVMGGDARLPLPLPSDGAAASDAPDERLAGRAGSAADGTTTGAARNSPRRGGVGVRVARMPALGWCGYRGPRTGLLGTSRPAEDADERDDTEGVRCSLPKDVTATVPSPPLPPPRGRIGPSASSLFCRPATRGDRGLPTD